MYTRFMIDIRGRIPALDSLRGVAAVVVVLTHLFLILPESLRDQLWWVHRTPLRMLVNGHASVLLFFVLSGFVLALPYLNQSTLSYGVYLYRRFCRIYLPYFIAFLFAWGLWNLHDGSQLLPGTSEWLTKQWPGETPDISTILGHIFLSGTNSGISLNRVFWSLVHEMRVSIIFPLLVVLCLPRKGGAASTLGIYVAASAFAFMLEDTFALVGNSFASSLVLTLRFVPIFMVGILLAMHIETLYAYFMRLPTFVRYTAWLAVPATFMFPRIPVLDIAQSLGCAIIIFLILSSPTARKWLEAKPCYWLGRISYSLYLVHTPIILFSFNKLYPILGMWPCMVIATLASFIAAEIFYRTVEYPSHKLGRRFFAPKMVHPSKQRVRPAIT
ncbi:MAG: acyltransferase [Blastochloris viridis]|uniref:Acyltransferase n=1 Tax=Blastochloris viridis TaxID=1079 RepID=A0A6N4RD41_BLAVI|nr:MAG: acyltransferase [Blastochloris viridis]